MENKKLLIGAAFSALLLLGCDKEVESKTEVLANETETKVQCYGVNSCQGKGQCGGEKHNCHGKNSCKGKGWIQMTAKECKDKSGKFKA